MDTVAVYHYVTRLAASTLEQLLEDLPTDQAPELWDRTPGWCETLEVFVAERGGTVTGARQPLPSITATMAATWAAIPSPIQKLGRRS